MTRLLLDTSVLLAWFQPGDDDQTAAARRLRAAHLQGDVSVLLIDLALYEIGNVLVRSWRWGADDAADQLEEILALTGAPIALDAAVRRGAARLAEQHRLTFYDACWAAAAIELGVSLVSADRALLAAGLAEPATDVVTRLRL